ncbi:uncharacterized protein LOC129259592 [Lytechinus pictus]|uniref:uncharacterized protein LOC129259592 n=1 Tax=Lytechinus pictus TaxID=7653 RepID=UPI0030B9B901
MPKEMPNGASVPSDRIHHFSTGLELIQALTNGQVDVAFAIKLPQLEAGFQRLTPNDFANNCYLDGAGMMTRKDNTEFLTWWNDAFGRLVGTPILMTKSARNSRLYMDTNPDLGPEMSVSDTRNPLIHHRHVFEASRSVNGCFCD